MAAYIRDRRKYSRIEKSFRVEYVVDGRRSMAFAVNMSMGGMLLRSASQLNEGHQVDFMLALPGAPEALNLQGTVLARQANQARIAFTAEHPGLAALQSYFETVIIPELETALEGPRSDTARLLTLARLYADFGRTGDALALYRSQRTAQPNDIRLLEQMALFLLQLGEAQPPYPSDLLPELESVIIAGLAVDTSEVLSYVKRCVEEVQEERRRAQQELAQQAEQQRQNERLADELRSRGQQLDAAVAERRRQLEEEYLQRSSEAHAAMQQSFAAERAALAQLQQNLQEREQHLAAAQAAESSRVAAVFAELQVKQNALEQQQRDFAAERAAWMRDREQNAAATPTASLERATPPPVPVAERAAAPAVEVHAPSPTAGESSTPFEPVDDDAVTHVGDNVTTDPNFPMTSVSTEAVTRPDVSIEEWVTHPAKASDSPEQPAARAADGAMATSDGEVALEVEVAPAAGAPPPSNLAGEPAPAADSTPPAEASTEAVVSQPAAPIADDSRPVLMNAAESLAVTGPGKPGSEPDEADDPQAEVMTLEVTNPTIKPRQLSFFASQDGPLDMQVHSVGSSTDGYRSWQESAQRRRRLLMSAGAAAAALAVILGIAHVVSRPQPAQSTASSFTPDPNLERMLDKPVLPEPVPAPPRVHMSQPSASHPGKHVKTPTHTPKKTKSHH